MGIIIGVTAGGLALGVAATASPRSTSVPPDSVPPDSVPTEGDEGDTGLGPAVTPVYETPPLITDTAVTSGPLIPVPAGCVAPDPARVVFMGTLLMADTTTGRFSIDRVLAGSADGYAAGRIIDVRYGTDARFLDPDTRYIVGAGVQRGTGVLQSKVREPAPLFGGDAVIGLNDTDVECPRLEDPVRTLHIDGTSVDSGVFTPLQRAKGSLLLALLRPLAVAFVVLLGLVLVKHLLFAVGRSLRDVVTGADEQQMVRFRQHGDPYERVSG